jgi:hypothetical protein
VPKTAMRAGLPSLQCTAIAKHTGERCRRRSVVGTTVCSKHGAAAPQVRRKAHVRTTFSQLVQHGERRPVGDIMREGIHVFDLAVLDVLDEIAATGEWKPTPEQYARLLDLVRQRHQLAKELVSTGVEVQIAEQLTRNIEAEAKLITDAVIAAVNALNLNVDDRLYALGVAMSSMTGSPMPERPLVRELSPVTREHEAAVDRGGPAPQYAAPQSATEDDTEPPASEPAPVEELLPPVPHGAANPWGRWHHATSRVVS